MPKKLPPICIHIPTKRFVISTLKRTKHPIDLPPRGKFYNCSSKNIVYLITCNSNKCKAQYVGYTQRACKQRLLEHLTDQRSPVHKHLEENNHERKRITMHILTQAPTEEKDTETWLKTTRIQLDMYTRNLNKNIHERFK